MEPGVLFFWGVCLKPKKMGVFLYFFAKRVDKNIFLSYTLIGYFRKSLWSVFDNYG